MRFEETTTYNANYDSKEAQNTNSKAPSYCARYRRSTRFLNFCNCFQFHRELLTWYDGHYRELPWRRPPRSFDQIHDVDAFAYRVWVSEVMLQQTQVVKVVDYFKQWMERWPKVEDLAKADLEDVREVWAGLGYYSRATNLHKGAQFIMETFNGVFPNDVDELMKIPG